MYIVYVNRTCHPWRLCKWACRMCQSSFLFCFLCSVFSALNAQYFRIFFFPRSYLCRRAVSAHILLLYYSWVWNFFSSVFYISNWFKQIAYIFKLFLLILSQHKVPLQKSFLVHFRSMNIWCLHFELLQMMDVPNDANNMLPFLVQISIHFILIGELNLNFFPFIKFI